MLCAVEFRPAVQVGCVDIGQGLFPRHFAFFPFSCAMSHIRTHLGPCIDGVFVEGRRHVADCLRTSAKYIV